MRREPVRSSSVSSAGYDPKTRTLELEFHGGHVYEYYDVPAAIFRRLMTAESVGAFVNRFVIPGYECRKV